MSACYIAGMNDPAPKPLPIEHQRAATRGAFHLTRDGERLAEMTYSATPDGKHIIIDHTQVSEQLKGQGVGKKLVEAAVAWARKEHVKVAVTCPFAKAVFEKTPELRDVLG